MASTVEICESNGAGETITHSITNTNMGSNDSVNLDTNTYAINPGNNSYEKWQRVHLSTLGSTSVDQIKIWRVRDLGANATHLTNARTSSYGGAETYATPVATASSVADQTMPTSQPATANLGIAGSLTGQLTATGYSDYLVHQIQTTGSATTGNTTLMCYQYREIQ